MKRDRSNERTGSVLPKSSCKSFFDSFAGGLGSALGYGFVSLPAILFLYFVFVEKPIVTFGQFVTTCDADSNGFNCIAHQDCDVGFVVIGGECAVRTLNPAFGEIYLQNFGLKIVDGDKGDPRRFECVWSGPGAQPGKGMVPQVRAACVSRLRFSPPPSLHQSISPTE